ncbi:MAG TPA: hypothetical protein VGR27_11115 [Longimicrobiaceae bacterium]|nr:hypothetical protein [Longimicrobiaceae bacterium]
MHILVTDVLTCPRCGPGFGLILLADRLEERRIYEGGLGCANCRERYAVHGGFADLRYPPGPALASEAAPSVAEDAAIRLAALLGITGSPGRFLFIGSGAALAPAIAALVPEVEILAADSALASLPEQPGVSRLAAGAVLPFASRSMRAVALTASDERLEEALRVLSPGGRIVLDPAAPGSADRLREAGLRVLLDEEGVVVASPPLDR